MRCIVEVTEKTIQGLDDFLKEQLETDIVANLAERLGLSSAEAIAAYFSTRMPELIANGTYGIQYLSAEYLTDEVIKELERANPEQ